MGQYFLIVNVTKKQYLSPHDFGHGAKLLEFTPTGGGIMMALGLLLAEETDIPGKYSWAGDNVIICGDWGRHEEYHTLAVQEYVDIGPAVRKQYAEDFREEAQFREMVAERTRNQEAELLRLKKDYDALCIAKVRAALNETPED